MLTRTSRMERFLATTRKRRTQYGHMYSPFSNRSIRPGCAYHRSYGQKNGRANIRSPCAFGKSTLRPSRIRGALGTTLDGLHQQYWWSSNTESSIFLLVPSNENATHSICRRLTIEWTKGQSQQIVESVTRNNQVGRSRTVITILGKNASYQEDPLKERSPRNCRLMSKFSAEPRAPLSPLASLPRLCCRRLGGISRGAALRSIRVLRSDSTFK